MSITPLNVLRVSRHQIPAHKRTPNTSIQGKPLLIYHGVFPRPTTPSAIESHLKSVGVVSPQWRYTMFSDSHFHSSTHEVLGIASGSAMCCFGGEENEARVDTVLKQGDVVIIPAGVSHRLLEDFGGFQMVGSYPQGKTWDMCYGKAGEEHQIKQIQDLRWFDQDPIYGDHGPSLEV